MVATACRTLLESLDRIPNEDSRTKIAIICFDVALHFFSMPVRAFNVELRFYLTLTSAGINGIIDARCL